MTRSLPQRLAAHAADLDDDGHDTHGAGGVADLTDVPTVSTDTSLVASPDGSGHMGLRAEAGGPPSGAAGGELGGMFPDPTVNATHSGSTHAGIQAAAEAASDPVGTAAGLIAALGLGTASTHAATDFDAAGAAATAQANAEAASDPVGTAAAAITALGLGTAATHAAGDFDAAGAAAAAQAASQPLDSDLTALAGLAVAADTLPYGTGSHTMGLATFTAAGRALVDDATAADQRTTLGLGTAAVAATGDFDAAGVAAAAIVTHDGLADPHTGYVLESLIDAAGDLFVGTADNTVGRLAKGADSTVLTVDPVTHLLAWNAAAAPSGITGLAGVPVNIAAAGGAAGVSGQDVIIDGGFGDGGGNDQAEIVIKGGGNSPGHPGRFGIYSNGSTGTLGQYFGALGDTTGQWTDLPANGAAGTPTMRKIGAGATDVIAGNDARLTDSRTPTAHGASLHTDITRSVLLPAAQAKLDGATAANVGASPDLTGVVAYADAATSGALWTFQVPLDWASGVITLQPVWSPGSSDGTAHTVRWSIIAKTAAAGTTVTAAGTTVTFTGASAARTAGVLVYDTATSTTLTPAAAGDLFRFELRRIGADAADTYVGVVNLLGVIMTYTANQ